MAEAERRAAEIDRGLKVLERQQIDEQDLAAALAQFDPVWDGLSIREQSRLLHLLIERIGYDGGAGKVSVTFRPSGIRSLAAEATG